MIRFSSAGQPILLVALLLQPCPTAFATPGAAAQADEQSSPAEPGNDVQLWTTQVAPLLQEHCWSCHGSDTQESDLRLDTLQGLSRGGKAGPPVIPGKPAESLLLITVRHADPALRMPPEEKLSDEQVATLERWIAAGAPHPEGQLVISDPVPHFDVNEARSWWSLQPLQAPQLPADAASGIDVILSGLQREKGVQLNPAADAVTLLRRAHFALTGIPPTPAQVDEFLADPSPAAFSRVIDQLMETQQYGERWARHWLDVARYADSNGLDENIAHGNAWRYRNYVIRSLQHDKPFDQFLAEQIAGDLLAADVTEEDRRGELFTATGFLSLGPKVLAEGDEKKLLLDIIDEQMDTIGRSMLGMTIGCARCHDHKFDPISQADYYALSGIFQSTKTMESLARIAKWHENPIDTAADRDARQAHQQQLDELQAQINTTVSAASATAGSPQDLPDEKLPQDVQTQLKQMREQHAALTASLPELPTAMGVTEAEVTPARILARGNHLAPGRVVQRAIPVVFDPTRSFTVAEDRSGRLAFANWLTGPQNPLTARVIVNRVWRWHFGRGIVATTDNFGKLGERPISPELLDWLAVQFVESGWSLKALHRLILTSRTWQASTADNTSNEAVDPDNQLFWKWDLRRMEAEIIRDSILAVTQTLDPSMGTSLLHVDNRKFLFDHTSKDTTNYDSQLRSVYLPVIRNNIYDAMALFDCTDGAVPNGNRGSSTVASQALFMMNSDLIIRSCRTHAESLLQLAITDRERVELLVQRTLGRPATPAHTSHLLQAIAQLQAHLQQEENAADAAQLTAWTVINQTLLMSNEFLYVR